MRHQILISTAVATAAISSLALSGCGDDDVDALPVTTAAAADQAPETGSDLAGYCADLQAAFGEDGDPGFGQFFADHPEPTLDDWAAFLPGPIAGLTAVIDGIAALDPPAEVADEHIAVVDAMTAVRDSLQTGLDFAAAGDQAGFDQNGQAPGDAMEAAAAQLGAACGFEE
jgi:hypothetical protein